MDRDARGQHPQTVGLGAQVVEIEGEGEKPDGQLSGDRQVARGDVAENRAERPILLRHPGRLAHAAPLRKSTTLTVSNTIVRSKKTDRCLM